MFHNPSLPPIGMRKQRLLRLAAAKTAVWRSASLVRSGIQNTRSQQGRDPEERLHVPLGECRKVPRLRFPIALTWVCTTKIRAKHGF